MEKTDDSPLDRQIRDAMGIHQSLRHRLREAVEHGGAPGAARAIPADSAGKLGKWLSGLSAAQSVSSSPHYRAVVTAHAGFHKTVERVARLVEDGQAARAAEILVQFEDMAAGPVPDILMSEMEAWRRSI